MAEHTGMLDMLMDDGLVYADECPYNLEILDHPPTEVHLSALNADNDRMFRYLVSIDEHLHENHDDDPIANDMARLEFKLNVLMDMVSQALADKLGLPAALPLELNALGLVAHSEEAIPVGQWIQASVYLNRQFVKPFVVCGQVEICRESGGRQYVLLRFSGLSENVIDHIEKFIFIQHRRMIAQRPRGQG